MKNIRISSQLCYNISNIHFCNLIYDLKEHSDAEELAGKALQIYHRGHARTGPREYPYRLKQCREKQLARVNSDDCRHPQQSAEEPPPVAPADQSCRDGQKYLERYSY